MSSIMKEDWVECTLGDILSVSSGKGLTSKNMDGGIFPVYGGNGITGYHSQYIFSEQKLIIGRVGVRCGVTHITQDKSWVTDNALVVNFKSKSIDLNFMKLKLQYENLNKLSNSTAQPVISGTKINSYFVELQPLPIQKSIVKKTEELFSSLDSGIADLKKAAAQLVIYRQAVLKKAFDLSSKVYKIGEVPKEIFAGGDKPKDFFSETKTKDLTIPIIANAVGNNGLYGYTKIARVNEVAITIAERGSGTGHVALRNEPFVPIVRLITIVSNLKKVVPKYLMYFLKNLNIKGGSAIPQLTIPTVKSYEINLPSLTEQHRIVREIESRLSVCDKVEESITESLEKAQALRQSILKKAFEGKLLSQVEIAKCKAHKDYETASVLLERIKKEKKK